MNKKGNSRGPMDAGIEKPVGPHTFRHYLAAQLFQFGTVVREIQELLGHEDL